MRILAVGRDEEQQASLRATLRRCLPFVQILDGHPGIAVLDQARTFQPHVALLAIDGPAVRPDALSVLRVLKGDPATRAIPVACIAGRDTDTARRLEALDAGADAFLARPVEEPELRALVGMLTRLASPAPAAAAPPTDARAAAAGDEGMAAVDLLGAPTAARAGRDPEAALRESERKYRTAVQASLDGYFMVDTGGRILDVNDALCRMLGYSREELLGMHLTDFEAAESAADTAAHMRRIEELGSDRFVTRHRCRDGSVIDVAISTQHVTALGDVFVTFVRDVTEQLRLLAALRDSEDRYRSLVERSGEGIGIVDLEERFVFANPSAETIFGVPPGSLVGRSLRDFVALDDFGRLEAFIRERASGQATRYLLEVRRPDGSLRTLSVATTTRRDAQGAAVGSFGVFRDVTEHQQALDALRRSEELYRTLVEASQTLVWRCARGGQFVYLNHAWEKTHGYRLDEMLGRRFSDFQRPDMAARNEQALARVSGGGSLNGFQTTHVAKDGTDVHLLFNAMPLHDAEGHVVGAQGTAVDVTERTRSEQRERLARDVLDTLNTREGFADTVHDILQLLVEGTGIEAVALRLRDGDDIPYYAATGFPEEFVRRDRHACLHGDGGAPTPDAPVEPLWGCMCRNVIHGRTSTEKPWFTEGGSFWINSTTDLLEATRQGDLDSPIHARCNAWGYESVALIPVRANRDVIGLLQLNDRRRDQFTLEFVHFLEGLGASIGLALTRQREQAERLRLEREILDISERERRHVGHELHDRVCQQLAAALLRSELVRRAGDLPAATAKHLRLLHECVEAALGEAHGLARGLVPTPQELRRSGESLERQVRAVCERLGVACEFRQQGDASDVAAPIMMQLERICQEAITNAVRHGLAHGIAVELEPLPGQLQVTIDDDGGGFDVHAKVSGGMGLRIMQYRARTVGGTLTVEPRAGGGMRVRCLVPRAIAPESP